MYIDDNYGFLAGYVVKSNQSCI